MIVVATVLRLPAVLELRLTEDPSLHLAIIVCSTGGVVLVHSFGNNPHYAPFLRGQSTTETTIFDDSTGQASRTGYNSSKARHRSTSNRILRFDARKAFVQRSQSSQSQSTIEIARRHVHTPSRAGPRLRHNLPSTLRTDWGSISSGSNESQHMILRKDVVSWKVDRDEQ